MIVDPQIVEVELVGPVDGVSWHTKKTKREEFDDALDALSPDSDDEADVIFVSQVNHGDGLSTVKYRRAASFDLDLEPSMFFRLVAEER